MPAPLRLNRVVKTRATVNPMVKDDSEVIGSHTLCEDTGTIRLSVVLHAAAIDRVGLCAIDDVHKDKSVGQMPTKSDAVVYAIM
jgi:hypothetical protein